MCSSKKGKKKGKKKGNNNRFLIDIQVLPHQMLAKRKSKIWI
jgi:hypothetical protein